MRNAELHMHCILKPNDANLTFKGITVLLHKLGNILLLQFTNKYLLNLSKNKYKVTLIYLVILNFENCRIYCNQAYALHNHNYLLHAVKCT